jgi:hypothetical protein
LLVSVSFRRDSGSRCVPGGGYLPGSNCESLPVAALMTFFAVSMVMVVYDMQGFCFFSNAEILKCLGGNREENSQPVYTILHGRSLIDI